MESGEEALLACKLTPPHGILLDNQLHDMTGLDFLEKANHTLSVSEPPLIFLMGTPNEEIAAQAIRLGAHDYFIKNTLSEEFLWRHIQQAVNHLTTLTQIHSLERQSSTIFQSSGDGLVVVGMDGRIRFTNPAAEQLFQRSNEQLVGSPFEYPLIQGETREITIRGHNTKTTPVEIRVTAIEWENTPAYLTSLRDLRERRKAEEERQRHETERQFTQKQESLGVLAGGIAHDFNNLLMSIVARAGLALRSLSPDSPAREHLQIIEKSGLRGGELANQMLAFAGQTQLDFQTINLHQFLKDLKSFLRSSVSKRIHLTFKFAARLPPIRGDRSQLRQLLMNIITNAAEAIGDQDGTIQISTSTIDTSTQDLRHYHIMGDLPYGPCVSFKIEDTGSGIKPELIPKIFDPFFSTKFPGRGLGLAALSGIIRGHGAALAVHSTMDVGTEFLFLFPTTPAPSPPNAPSLTLPKNPLSNTIRSKVLVVDDEDEVRTACSLILKEIGFDALVAQDGQSGEYIFKSYQEEIALVFLDLTMPHVDGGKLAEKIRMRDQGVPILVTSGYPEEEAMKHFAQSGINAFIQKPFQVEILITKIQELTGMNVR
jgi:signal transduction histidine kinase